MSAAHASLLRLLLAAVVLLPATWLGGDAVVRAAVPTMGRVLPWIAPDFEVQRIAMEKVRGEQRLTIKVNLSRTTIVGTRVLVPDPRGSATAHTLAGHGLLAPLVAAFGIAGWPVGRPFELLARLALLLPLLAMWLVLDAPLVLAAALWQLMLDAVAPGTSSLLVKIPGFLVGGGRIVIGLAMAAGVVYAVNRLFVRLLPVTAATQR